MFNKKIEERIYRLEARVGTIDSEINQLRCKHEKTEFKSKVWPNIRGFHYQERCLVCQKELQAFNSEIDYRDAIVKDLEMRLLKETAKLKGRSTPKRE